MTFFVFRPPRADVKFTANGFTGERTRVTQYARVIDARYVSRCRNDRNNVRYAKW